jgi:hypothetical protein
MKRGAGKLVAAALRKGRIALDDGLQHVSEGTTLQYLNHDCMSCSNDGAVHEESLISTQEISCSLYYSHYSTLTGVEGITSTPFV